MTTPLSRFRAVFSALLSLLIVALSPGLASYQACATGINEIKGDALRAAEPAPAPAAAVTLPFLHAAGDFAAPESMPAAMSEDGSSPAAATEPSLLPDGETLTPEGKKLLEQIRKNAPKAYIIDFDGTVVDRGPDGLSLPVPAPLREKIERVLRRAPLVVLTGRSFDFKTPTEDKIPMTIVKPLVSRLRLPRNKNFIFVGRLGGELVAIDGQSGRVKRILQGDWNPEEKPKLKAAVDETLKNLGIARESVTLIEVPGHTNVVFPKDDPRAGVFGKALAERFKADGILYSVVQQNEWIFFAKYDKGDGMRLAVAALKAMGHEIEPEEMIYIADSFAMHEGRASGSDAPAALAFPRMPAASVGGSAAERRPSNVTWLGVSGSRGLSLVLQAALDGLAARRRVLLRTLVNRLALGGLYVGALVTFPYLVVHSGVAAAAAGVILTVIGVPQIIMNAKLGKNVTRFIPLDALATWFAAGLLLGAAAHSRPDPLAWQLANVVGTVFALGVIAQKNYYERDAALVKETLSKIGKILGVAAFAWILRSDWTGYYYAALPFLVGINFPQIDANHQIYAKNEKLSEGLAWMPALVNIGNLINLIPAFASHNPLWVATSLIGIAMTSVVLGQIFAPGLVNPVLAPIIRGIKSAKARMEKIIHRGSKDGVAMAALPGWALATA